MTELRTLTTYSDELKAQALSLRLQGARYKTISQELHIPESTLQKWFAPSANRHHLSTLKGKPLKEVSAIHKQLLYENLEPVIEKLIKLAIGGDIRAITEIFDRIDGKPVKQKTIEPHQFVPALVTFVDSPKPPTEKVLY